MGRKNREINGTEYYEIKRKVGMKQNSKGDWIPDYKHFYGHTKKDAEKQFKEYMESHENGFTSNEIADILISRWIETVFKSSALKNSTMVKYISAYESLFKTSKLAGRKLKDIQAIDLQELYNEHEEHYNNVIALHNLLSRFYKYADLNRISHNITSSLSLPKRKTKGNEIDVWQDAELKAFIDALNGHRLKLFVVLACSTGLRFSELLALTYDDIKDGKLTVNKQLAQYPNAKTGEKGFYIERPKSETSNRELYLTDVVLQELETHRRWHKAEMLERGYRTNNIFTTTSGNYYYRSSVTDALNRVMEDAGIKHHTIHALRHTFGTNLNRANVGIKEICELMGHSDTSITCKYYVKGDDEEKKDAMKKVLTFAI